MKEGADVKLGGLLTSLGFIMYSVCPCRKPNAKSISRSASCIVVSSRNREDHVATNSHTVLSIIGQSDLRPLCQIIT